MKSMLHENAHIDLKGKDSPDTLLDVDQGNCDGSFKTSARWEASEERTGCFSCVILKPMPRFDRRAIIREFPRPRPT